MSKKVVLVFAVGLIIVPLIFYWIDFGSLNRSERFSDWKDFSDFWSPFLSLSVAIITGYIAFIAYNFSKSAETPRITFESIKLNESVFYVIKNAGKVPAVNCRLFIKNTNSTKDWDEEIICYTIKPEEIKIISWAPTLNKALMIYDSFAKRNFSTLIDNDNNIFDNHTKPKLELKVSRYAERSSFIIEQDIIKLITGSSEAKEDIRMLMNDMANKASVCSDTFNRCMSKPKKTIASFDYLNYEEAIIEIIIAIQSLDNSIEILNSNFINNQRQILLKHFWLVLSTDFRFFIKDQAHQKTFVGNKNLFEENFNTIVKHFEWLFKDF